MTQNRRFQYYPARAPRLGERGITGTQYGGGVISGYEQNPILTGINWVREHDEMLRTDPIVMRGWHMLRQTLLSASWRFEPGINDDVTAEELARYANEAFGFGPYAGQMKTSWESQLSYLLQFVTLGYRYAEEIYKVGPDSTGRVKVWLSHYADREPSAHQKWLSKDNQHLDGVLQNMIGLTTPEPIPANKLLLLTLNQTGSNFEGVGLLRPAWYPWRAKQRNTNLLFIGVERAAIPTPKIVIDRAQAESLGYTDGDIDAMSKDAEAQAQALLATDQSYLVENPAVKFETYAPGDSLHVDKALAINTMCDSQISAAFLTQFADLGNTETGARSVGEIHLSVFRRAAINLCDIVAAAVSGVDRPGGGTIGRLIRWNYGAVDPSKLPRLTHTGLDTDDLADSLAALPALVDAGLLTPTDDLERAIRDRLGAGELSPDDERSPLSRIAVGGSAGAISAMTEKMIRGRRET